MPQVLIGMRKGVTRVLSWLGKPVFSLGFLAAIVFIFAIIFPHTPFWDWYWKYTWWEVEPIMKLTPPFGIREVVEQWVAVVIRRGIVLVVLIGSPIVAFNLGNPVNRFRNWKQRRWWVNTGLGVSYLVIAPGCLMVSVYAIGVVMLIWVLLTIGAIAAGIPLAIIWICAVSLVTMLYWFTRWIGVNDYEAQFQRMAYLLGAIALILGVVAAAIM